MRFLPKIFRAAVKSGSLELRGPDGFSEVFGDGGSPHVAVRVTDPGLDWKIFLNPELKAAEAYMDGGLDAAEKFIKRCWIFDTMTKEPDVREANPKTQLSDWCGANRTAYAAYETLETSGPDHAPVFTVKASVEGHGEATAKGGNKAEAERAAARALLDLLEQS